MTEEQIITFLFALAKVTNPNSEIEIKGEQNEKSEMQV